MRGNISKSALIKAFSKIKSHFLEIEFKINQNTTKLTEIEQRIINIENKLYNPQISPKEISSIGNQGVLSNMHSLNIQTCTHSNMHSNSHFSPKSFVEELFNTLTTKEFLIFLTIFQSDQITYAQIAQKLSLTSGCVRTYVSEMIRKKIPLIKHKLKSRKVILYVDKEFKTLTSEQKLINLYYKNIDPDQTTLI